MVWPHISHLCILSADNQPQTALTAKISASFRKLALLKQKKISTILEYIYIYTIPKPQVPVFHAHLERDNKIKMHTILSEKIRCDCDV